MVLANFTPHSHLYNTSGSGKTRLSLDGLCHNWGIYISCRDAQIEKTGGSVDFYVATNQMLTWDKDLNSNAKAADRVFAMLMCARVFILKQLLDGIPPSTSAMTARRRWVLLQAMPPCRQFYPDIFAELIGSIRGGDESLMLDFVRSTLTNLSKERTDLFPQQGMFLVLDEAQDAAKNHANCFPSTTDPSQRRSLLHETYKSLACMGIFTGIILSGTRLSMDIINVSLGSFSVKEVKPIFESKISTDTGDFLDKASQESYVRRYLNVSNCISDRRFLERIQHWFKGRYVR